MYKPHPIHIILRALELGQTIKDDGIEYCFSDDCRFGYAVTSEEHGDHMIMIDFSLNSLLAFAEKMPKEELIAIAANNALCQMRLEDLERQEHDYSI